VKLVNARKHLVEPLHQVLAFNEVIIRGQRRDVRAVVEVKVVRVINRENRVVVPEERLQVAV
jgi:hypothetical protein